MSLITGRPGAGAVVWDFDGTVADTFASILHCAEVAAAPALGASCDPAIVRGAIGLPLAAMFERLLPDASADDVLDLVAAYREEFARVGAEHVTAFAGIADLLERTSARGTRHAIATSRSRWTLDAMLDHLAMGPLFDAIACNDDVANHKPHPEMVEVACRRVGTPTSRTMVVGDTTFDIEMGNRAGATTCAVTWGNHDEPELLTASPDHVVDTVEELEVVLSDFASLHMSG